MAEWIKEIPSDFMPGMLLLTTKGKVILVGDCNEGLNFYGANDMTMEVCGWRWAINLYEVRDDEYRNREPAS